MLKSCCLRSVIFMLRASIRDMTTGTVGIIRLLQTRSSSKNHLSMIPLLGCQRGAIEATVMMKVMTPLNSLLLVGKGREEAKEPDTEEFSTLIPPTKKMTANSQRRCLVKGAFQMIDTARLKAAQVHIIAMPILKDHDEKIPMGQRRFSWQENLLQKVLDSR